MQPSQARFLGLLGAAMALGAPSALPPQAKPKHGRYDGHSGPRRSRRKDRNPAPRKNQVEILDPKTGHVRAWHPKGPCEYYDIVLGNPGQLEALTEQPFHGENLFYLLKNQAYARKQENRVGGRNRKDVKRLRRVGRTHSGHRQGVVGGLSSAHAVRSGRRS